MGRLFLWRLYTAKLAVKLYLKWHIYCERVLNAVQRRHGYIQTGIIIAEKMHRVEGQVLNNMMFTFIIGYFYFCTLVLGSFTPFSYWPKIASPRSVVLIVGGAWLGGGCMAHKGGPADLQGGLSITITIILN